MKYDIHYQLISKIYEGKHAERSGVPYMNHINEGLMICDLMNFSLPTKQAYCLHPLFQNDKDLAETFKTQIIYKIGVRALALVMEYRNKANSYLSNKTKEVQDISLSPINEVNQMLIVDKIQNRKDFEIYHLGTHPRSEALDTYFKNWLERLEIDENHYQQCKSIICNDDFKESHRAVERCRGIATDSRQEGSIAVQELIENRLEIDENFAKIDQYLQFINPSSDTPEFILSFLMTTGMFKDKLPSRKKLCIESGAVFKQAYSLEHANQLLSKLI